MFENFQVVKVPQRLKCNKYFMASPKEKCKTNILTEGIFSMYREVSSSTTNRTGAWFSVDLSLYMQSEKKLIYHFKTKCSQYLLRK